MSDLARSVEALLFLSAEPVRAADLAVALEVREAQIDEAIEVLREDLAPGKRGIELREVAGGFALASAPAGRRMRARSRASSSRKSNGLTR